MFQAESISMKEGTVFLSEILRFKKSVIIEENGIARTGGSFVFVTFFSFLIISID